MDEHQAIEKAKEFLVRKGAGDLPLLGVRHSSWIPPKAKKSTEFIWVVEFRTRNVLGEDDVRLIYVANSTQEVWEWIGGRKSPLPPRNQWDSKRSRQKTK